MRNRERQNDDRYLVYRNNYKDAFIDFLVDNFLNLFCFCCRDEESEMNKMRRELHV